MTSGAKEWGLGVQVEGRCVALLGGARGQGPGALEEPAVQPGGPVLAVHQLIGRHGPPGEPVVGALAETLMPFSPSAPYRLDRLRYAISAEFRDYYALFYYLPAVRAN